MSRDERRVLLIVTLMVLAVFVGILGFSVVDTLNRIAEALSKALA